MASPTSSARGFASDNSSGIHPKVLAALQAANQGHARAYGHDPITERALALLRKTFGAKTDPHFVFNGTGANTLGLRAVTQSFHSVLAAETSHLHVDECGAPEKITGCKLIPISTADGKLTVEALKPHIRGIGDPHHSQPKVVSITQVTELGTVYSIREIKALSAFAHRQGLLLHMDGARLANAAAALGVSLKALTFDAGVDLLSFGGTKNGLLFGEAVIFRDRSLAKDFPYVRKQGMQLASKMRFLAAQFEALLKDGLWLENARHANRMAALLAREAAKVPGLRLTRKVQANGVFALLPKRLIKPLQAKYFFYVWDEGSGEVRWMCSFDTQEEDIRGFVALLRKALAPKS